VFFRQYVAFYSNNSFYDFYYPYIIVDNKLF